MISPEDVREALRVRRWRHNIQKVMLQTSPAVALTHEVRRCILVASDRALKLYSKHAMSMDAFVS